MDVRNPFKMLAWLKSIGVWSDALQGIQDSNVTVDWWPQLWVRISIALHAIHETMDINIKAEIMAVMKKEKEIPDV